MTMSRPSPLCVCTLTALVALSGCAAADDPDRSDGAEVGLDDGGPSSDEGTDTAQDDAGASTAGTPASSAGDDGDDGDDGTSGDDGTPPDPTDEWTEGGDDGSTGGDPGTDATGEPAEGTGEAPPPFGDGDSSDLPALRLQFRVTAGAPIDVEGPLFNDDALDVRGARYTDVIDPLADATDHLEFNIVPGESDPYLRVTLTCDDPAVRAEIRDEGDALVGMANCGAGEVDVLLVGAGSTDVYRVIVRAGVDDFETTDYSLALDAFCFGGCNYQPWGG